MINFMNITADPKIDVAKILRGSKNIDHVVAVASNFIGKRRR
jgi:hypothetical protein